VHEVREASRLAFVPLWRYRGAMSSQATTLTLIVALVSILMAALHQELATGTLLGTYKWPAALSPWATLVLAFGGAFVAALQTTPAASYVQAALAGLLAIPSTMGASAAMQSHFQTKAKIQAHFQKRFTKTPDDILDRPTDPPSPPPAVKEAA
jgi:TctA family transporter